MSRRFVKIWDDPTPGYVTDHGDHQIVVHRTWRTSPAGWVWAVRAGDEESRRDPAGARQLGCGYAASREQAAEKAIAWIDELEARIAATKAALSGEIEDGRAALVARRVRGGGNLQESTALLEEILQTCSRGTLAHALHYNSFATERGAEKFADEFFDAALVGEG